MVETDVRTEITNIAEKVRKSCEAYIKECPAYYYTSTLGGLCGIASWALRIPLKKFKPRVAYGEKDWIGHCWLEVGEYIVDITATQFSPNYPPVYIELKENISVEGYVFQHYKRRYLDFGLEWSYAKPTPEKTRKILAPLKNFSYNLEYAK